MTMPIKSPCSKAHFPAHGQSGQRTTGSIELVVLHDTETPADSAGGVAAAFQSPRAEGSAHLVVDDVSCYRCLPDDVIPWAAIGANENGLHIEQCGYASWTAAEWERHLPMLHRAAYKAAVWGKKYRIPMRHVTAADLHAGRSGITTHHAVNRWQTSIRAPGDHSHTDPGTHYPIDLVVGLAKHYRSTL